AVRGGGQDDALGRGERVHVELAVTVGDLKEPGHAPARAPRVLHDPALLGVGVPDHLDAVPTPVHAGDVVVDAAGVGEEVVVDVERRRARPGVGEVVLPVRDGREAAVGGDLHDRGVPV